MSALAGEDGASSSDRRSVDGEDGEGVRACEEGAARVRDGAVRAACSADDALSAAPEGAAADAFPLIDAHCHLDFAGNAQELAAALAVCGGALSGTCDPRDFDRAQHGLAPFASQVRVGLGLHPWWVADGACGPDEVALFERLAARVPLISEVGLDFQPRREATRDAQMEAFARVCQAAAKPLEGPHAGDPCAGDVAAAGGETRAAEGDVVAAGGSMASERIEEIAGHALEIADKPPSFKRVMSIHSSKAASETLDILGRTGCLDACTCVFHWFSGSQDELSRAIDAGCLFSVNERMLKTKRGRAYARAIPEDRLLLETDAPPKPVARFSPATHVAQLDRTLRLLAEARSADPSALAERIAHTSRMLFS